MSDKREESSGGGRPGESSDCCAASACCDSTDGNTAGKRNKKGKGKGKASGALVPASNGAAAGAASLSPEQQENLRKAMELISLQQQGPAKSEDEASKKSYQFWSTQPVPGLDEVVTTNECIAENVPTAEVRQEPFSLPAGFTWDTLQLDDPLVLKEVYVLLNENYVEDDDNMFRFDYSPEFIAWALQPPGWIKVATCRYWHRSINPKKLIEVKFSHLSRNMTMQRHLKLYRLPDQTKTPGMRKFRLEDSAAVSDLLNKYLTKFDLAPIFTEQDVQHWFLPQPNIIEAYVVEDRAAGGKLTDFVSFYTLPSTVMNHPNHSFIKAAYSFYNVSTATPWVELMGDALILAKREGFDVFNALDLMENSEFLETLKFGIGDGNLQYYLYNWKCPRMEPHKVGLVLQ